jgi:hypothetical protein
MLADLSSRPEWQRAKCVIVRLELGHEFLPALPFVCIKGTEPISHRGTAEVDAKAASDNFRNATRRRQERVRA